MISSVAINHASLVLLVEDDPAMSTMMTGLLEAAGFKVIQARTGMNALHAIERGAEPAVILLDLEMPTMNGGELFRELKRRPDTENIPVIVVSGTANSTMNVDRPSAMFGKPVPVDDLLQAVRRYAVPMPRHS